MHHNPQRSTNPQVMVGREQHAPALTLAIVVAMVAGGAVGAVFGTRVVALGSIGTVFIQLIKVMAVPLVFFSIIEALVVTAVRWRSAGVLALVVAINTSCALVLGLTLSNLLGPGVGFVRPAHGAGAVEAGEAVVAPTLDLKKALDAVVPESIVHPFSENNVVGVVLLALLLGGALRHNLTKAGAHVEVAQFERVMRAVLEVWGTALGWLVRGIPVAVFCVTARTIGEFGFEPLRGLALYVVAAVVGLLAQILLVYPVWIRWVAGLSLRRFIAVAKRPVAYAFGTNSSLATLPLTLNSLDSLGVPKAASRLGACMGTNLNNDGIVLYEAMAVLFVAQAYGVHLPVVEQVGVALFSLLAAVGVAGVPEAGVVSLSLVLGAVGLPLDLLPLLLAVDWIIARMRSVTNVLSDMTVSIGIAALDRRGS